MRAVVTGASGFIGSHLVDHLRARGAEVHVVRRAGAPAHAPMPGVREHVVDVLDADAVAAAPVWDGATHCFHLGGVTKARTAAEFERGNLVPTRHIVAALRKRGDLAPRLVQVSSQAAAGPALHGDRPVREDDPPMPLEGYGASKVAAEREVAAAGIGAVIVRPSVVYGPRDRDLCHAFRAAIAPVPLYAAPAGQQFSVVHVRDLVALLLLAAESPASRDRTYFAAAGEPVTWRQLYRAVADAAGVRRVGLQVPRRLVSAAAFIADQWPWRLVAPPLLNRHKVALSRPPWWTCDAARAREELGWAPAVAFAAGVRDTYAWYVEAGWLGASSRASSRTP